MPGMRPGGDYLPGGVLDRPGPAKVAEPVKPVTAAPPAPMPAYPAPTRNPADVIESGLKHFFQPGDVIELRMLNVIDGNPDFPFTESGYFDYDHLRQLAEHAAYRSGHAEGCYVTMNPVDPDLLARATNRAKRCGKRDKTTGDGETLRRTRLVFDADPQRKAGISSTEAEKALAHDKILFVADALAHLGWPEPIIADSGNGYHASYAIDLANDDDAKDLVERVLKAADQLWTDVAVKIDASLFNASRIMKLYGTMACKGDSIPTRPHRMARIMSVPSEFTVVPRELLESFAAKFVPPAAPEKPKKPASVNGKAPGVRGVPAKALDGPGEGQGGD
jgi:hypothetical protein